MNTHEDERSSASGFAPRISGGTAGVGNVFLDSLFGKQGVVLGDDSHFSTKLWDKKCELAVDLFPVDDHRTFARIYLAAQEFEEGAFAGPGGAD